MVLRRQDHITFIFIKMMSHDVLVQMAHQYPENYANKSIILQLLMNEAEHHIKNYADREGSASIRITASEGIGIIFIKSS